MNHFDELLKDAKLQSHPQLLLLLFAKATPMRGSHKTKHHSGTIVPVMCVDKLPGQVDSFESLVKEADSINDQWDFVLIGSLTNSSKKALPDEEEVEAQLHQMSNNLANGADLSAYLVLDRNQSTIVIS